MLRQLSVARRCTPRSRAPRHNPSGRDLVRSFATGGSNQHRCERQRRRTDLISVLHRCGSRNYNYNAGGNGFGRNRNKDLPSFHRLRACYFSNAAERTLDNGADEHDDDDNNDIDIDPGENSIPIDKISHQQPLDLLHPEDGGDPTTTVNFVQTLKIWYMEYHGKTGRSIEDAFDAKMIQVERTGGGGGGGEHPADNKAAIADAVAVAVDVVDHTQLFTASFTCPVTNETFRAGRLPGFFEVGDDNYYSKKKTALQAVSAVVLSHKQIGEDVMMKLAANVSDGSFRQQLQKLYMKTFKIMPTKSQCRMTIHYFAGEKYGGVWWTGDFVCPVTGRIYEAADLTIVPDSSKMKQAGRIWYRKKTDAIHASASTAIDSIDWDAEPIAPGKQQQQQQSPGGTTPKETPEPSDESTEILRLLRAWYQTHKGLAGTELSIEDNFVVTGGTDDRGRNVWTATFLCPLTGERFDSGYIIANDAFRVAEHVPDDWNWYMDRDAAMKAASFRAYDSLHYRETGVGDPRFCREFPSVRGTEQTQRLLILHEDMPGGDGGVNGDSGSDSDGEDNDAVNDEWGEDDDDEEDFIIEVIPQQLNLSQGVDRGSSKTLDIIAQAWIDSTGRSSNEIDPRNEVQSLNSLFAKRQKTIRRATEWAAQQKSEAVKPESDRTQFDVRGQISNLKIANAILSSLAETHQRIPFDSRPVGVEHSAAAILESMWSSQSTQPDAWSYAFYLKCLEGETPNDIAERAQTIVTAMESGHEYHSRLLPKPNDSVYGALAEVKALAGINTLVESSECESLDRNMHLCHLSVMAHNPGMFDIDIATQHIDRMKNLSEMNNCPSLHPDVEVYNAPLRWSGGSLRSRLYSRVIPWDSYGTIYQDGFKSESEENVKESRKQAETMENWIEIMLTKPSGDDAVAPNLETYESLIQAWVRCGSLDALSRAETVAKKLMAGDYPGVHPRIQSFYPIVGAWTYSGCDDGPQRVESWIDLIHTEGIDAESDLRLNFPNLPIMAELSLQRQVSSRSENPLNSWRCVRDSASRCSDLLEREIDRRKTSPDLEMQTDTFKLVINAWYTAASAAISNGNFEEARQCSREIQKVVNLFDDTLLWLYRNTSTKEENKSKFFSLLNQAPSIYGAQVAAFNRLNTTSDKVDIGARDDGTAKQFILIEEKIRRLEEFHFFLISGDNAVGDACQNVDIDIELKAMSPFPSEGFVEDSSCKDWADFIHLSLDSIAKDTRNFAVGEADFIRLCMLITRVASSAAPTVLHPDTKNRVVDRIVDLLETYGGQNQDRKAVVSKLVQSLKKRSGTLHDTGTKTFFGDESRYGESDNSDAVNGRDVADLDADAHAKRKVRRKRPRGSDLHRTSHSRSRVPNRTGMRRTRHHRTKTNDL